MVETYIMRDRLVSSHAHIHQHHSKYPLTLSRSAWSIFVIFCVGIYHRIMATTAVKKFNTIIFSFTIITVLFGCSSAIVYKVGDSDGWTAKYDTYYRWAEGKEFYVGDSLVFEYDRNLKDVTQVSGALELEFCDSSFPKAVYNTGHDVVTRVLPFH